MEVIRADIELAKRQIFSKRLHLDDQLSKIYGVQYFSCITLMMSNEKTSSPQCEEEGPGREIYPDVAYFIMYRPSEAVTKAKYFPFYTTLIIIIIIINNNSHNNNSHNNNNNNNNINNKNNNQQ